MGRRSALTDPDWPELGRSWWAHVRILADDSMQGRDTGSPGYERAADYVTQQYQAAGLEPAGGDGFRQRVEFRVSRLDESASSLDLIRDGQTVPVKLRDDAQFLVTSQSVPDLEADAVFVGYGLDIPELGFNDYAGVDVRGKLVVAFRGGPSDIPGPIKAHFQSPTERYRALRRAGAVGGVIISNPKVPDLPWPRLATGLLFPRMELLEPGPDETRPPALSVAFNPERLDLLLDGSGHTASEIVAALGGPGPLPRFPLAVRIRAHETVHRSLARCSNVVGLLRGSDPALRDEYVVATAHLDHLGVGEPIDGDRIYSGAMDNASGVASLIEIARSLKRSGRRPKRSLVFLAVTGEEKGLLGSEYFAQHPTISGRIVADLNMDMFLPLFPLRYLEVQGLEESTLGPELRALAGRRGIETDTEYEPERVLFIRSDQYNFVKVGVPSLALSIGYRKGTPEEEMSMGFFRDRYHAPADDVDQPVDRVAAAQFTDLLGEMLMQVANDPERPSWNSDSFFRRFAR